jgi:hypothetical protein
MTYLGSICPKCCIKGQPIVVPKLCHDFELPICLYAERVHTFWAWSFVQINALMFLEKKNSITVLPSPHADRDNIILMLLI